MSLKKQFQDYIVKIFLDGGTVPTGLFELTKYFKNNGPIEFKINKEGDEIIAVSKNFRFGSIIASAKNQEELDQNIKDAILTSFDVPSSYAKEAGIYNIGVEKKAYAMA